MIPSEVENKVSVALRVLVQLFNRVTCSSLENMVYHIPHPSKQDQLLDVIQWTRRACMVMFVCQKQW
jgi:hypothetical protein